MNKRYGSVHMENCYLLDVAYASGGLLNSTIPIIFIISGIVLLIIYYCKAKHNQERETIVTNERKSVNVGLIWRIFGIIFSILFAISIFNLIFAYLRVTSSVQQLAVYVYYVPAILWGVLAIGCGVLYYLANITHNTKK